MPDVDRKLAAILAADLVGYSRLTGTDEEGTLGRLRELRDQVIHPAVQAQRGRIVKEMGDGILVEFVSAVDAARAALDIQRQLGKHNASLVADKRLELRMGLHIGDVVVQSDGDVLGDTVNIAARLEGIAQPGGICLSEDAYRQIRNRLSARFQDLGEQQLKNIVHPLRVYAMQIGEQDDLSRGPPGLNKPRSNRADSERRESDATEHLELPQRVHVRAPGLRLELATVEKSIRFIDKNVPRELATLPRWTFARALLVEALRTRKARDLRAAVRQLSQALSNERWLDAERSSKK
jgi:class 3 adenylate cyclase